MLRKALEEQKKKSQNNNSGEQTTINQKTAITSGNCPPELLKEYNAALAKKVNFVDASFPPKLSTIGPNDKLDADMKSSLWLRPGQIFNSDYELFEDIEVEDIKQGSLGVCYYLATLSSLAER